MTATVMIFKYKDVEIAKSRPMPVVQSKDVQKAYYDIVGTKSAIVLHLTRKEARRKKLPVMGIKQLRSWKIYYDKAVGEGYE